MADPIASQRLQFEGRDGYTIRAVAPAYNGFVGGVRGYGALLGDQYFEGFNGGLEYSEDGSTLQQIIHMDDSTAFLAALDADPTLEIIPIALLKTFALINTSGTTQKLTKLAFGISYSQASD